jgi:hypothetical protein
MTAEDIKSEIIGSLNAFSDGNITPNALKLFRTLGYVTDRQSPLREKTFDEFKDTYIGNKKFDETKAKATEWKYVDLLFQFSKEEVLKQTSLFDTKKVDSTIIETYLFFSIGLSKPQYSRTELSLITREVNRLFPMPAMILFNHGNSLTLSVINRRLHKKDDNKDVLEKVTQIKDIKFESPHRAHIDILFDLSFDELKEKYQFTNFVELHNAWQKTLDIKELNKKFFNELANWYFWATQKVIFPDDAEKVKELRNATGVIRLITRLIFVWFLKEKNLVPEGLFDEKKLKQLLKYSDKNKSTYYKAILQNLFFATLNTEMGVRRFRIKSKDEKQRDGHHFIHNVFRYEEEFVNPKETLEKYFANIPFLNGGLFECLDSEIEKPNNKKIKIRIDGFSDREDNVLKVPDELFFCEKEKTIDLSDIYGTPKKSKEKVRGLINILDSYKFTIAENTPIEEEVALDPELLGKVFENLLANYNPETQTTARKQTGSFYTPREIVNYMVDESLIAYLKQQLNSNEIIESNLRDLLSYSEKEIQFSSIEKEKLINAIDIIKIIDPACGSGAFPMGILHKLVHILHKLDPKNKLWRQRQIEKANAIDDAPSREAAIETLEEAFENNELDYSRKLYLIENCIYGVDIQPIAVQISKLRFFISLIVEQKTNSKKENLGVRPLPNLETKFVAANTLIELEKEKQDLFNNEELKRKKEKLKIIRHDYFEARTPKRKEKCREEDKQLREEMAELVMDELVHFNKSIKQQIEKDETLILMLKKELLKSTLKEEQRKKIDKEFKKKTDKVEELKSHITNNKAIEQTAQKLSEWNPYNQNLSASFFDPEWMYGLKDGFDIVIGNPPWVSLIGKHGIEENKRNIELYIKLFGGNTSMPNLYEYFIIKAISLLNTSGHLTFIVPDRLGNNSSMAYLRKDLLLENTINEIVYRWKFESIIADTMTLLISKKRNVNNIIKVKYNPQSEWLLINSDYYKSDPDFVFKSYKNLQTQNLVKSIKLLGEPISKFCKSTSGFGGKSELIFSERTNKRQIEIIKGASISKYSVDKKLFFEFIREEITGRTKDETKLGKKIKVLLRKTGNTIIAAYDETGIFPEQSLYFLYDFTETIYSKYFLVILNSTLMTWYYLNELVTNIDSTPQLKTYDLDSIPIIINKDFEDCFVRIANLISCSKKFKEDYFNFFLKISNALVYELYLTKSIKAAKCEVLKHLNNLPMLKDGNEHNLKLIEKIYKEFSDPTHPVNAAMFNMDTIEEIAIIEGKK